MSCASSILAFLFVAQSAAFCFAIPGTIRPDGSKREFVSNSTSAEQQLSRAVHLAKQGDVKQGLSVAKDTLDIYPDDINTKLVFIETMVRIEKMPGKDHDVELLNCAIKVANEVNGVTVCDGSQDPALGFSYMRALGELAYAVEPKHDNIGIQLLALIGDVAVNLHQNPRVSQDSHKYLSAPYYDKARAHAVQGESELVAESLKVAFELGFSDYERARAESAFTNLDNAEEISKIIDNKRNAIIARDMDWARKSISEFNSFPFVFEIEGLENGKISNSDFSGKLLVVDLWATWCQPCLKSVPHFVQLKTEFSDKNVEVLGIAMDDLDDPISTREEVIQAVRKLQFNYPCGLGEHTVVSQIGGQLALPTTMMIDAQGNVRYINRGYLEYSKLEALTRVLLEMEKGSN